MTKLQKNILIVVCGIIVIIATISTFFLLNFYNSNSGYIGLGFLIFSELALFSGLIIILSHDNAPNNVFMRTGITISLELYFVITAVLLLISGLFKQKANIFMAFEIIALAVMLIIAISVVLNGSKINSTDQKTLSDRKLMQICEKRIFDLLSKSKNKACEAQLVIVAEKLKYCDKIGTSSVDEKIVGAIMKLEKELQTENDASQTFQELSSLILQRNSEIADLKRGGF